MSDNRNLLHRVRGHQGSSLAEVATRGSPLVDRFSIPRIGCRLINHSYSLSRTGVWQQTFGDPKVRSLQSKAFRERMLIYIHSLLCNLDGCATKVIYRGYRGRKYQASQNVATMGNLRFRLFMFHHDVILTKAEQRRHLLLFETSNCRTSAQGVSNHSGPSLPYVVFMASLSTRSMFAAGVGPGPAFSSVPGVAHGITTALRSCFSQLPGRVGSACPLFGFSRHRWRAWLPLLESASLTVILLRTSSLGN